MYNGPLIDNKRPTLVASTIFLLRCLPSPHEGVNELLKTAFGIVATCYCICFVGYGEITLSGAIGSVIVSIALILLLYVSDWLRRKLEQRYIPSPRMRKELKDLVALRLHADATRAGVYILSPPRHIAKWLYDFPSASDDDNRMTEMSELNCDIFRGSTYAGDLEQKLDRNQSHQARNRNCIMLLKFDDGQCDTSFFRSAPDNYIGFTHLIPISISTYRKYIAGKISDIDFDPELVCRPSDPAYAIIVFTLGIDLYKLKQLFTAPGVNQAFLPRALRRIGLNPVRSSPFYAAESDLWSGFIYHINKLIKNQKFKGSHVRFGRKKFKGQCIRIIAQSFNEKVSEVLLNAHFEPLSRTAFDGDPLFELKVLVR